MHKHKLLTRIHFSSFRNFSQNVNSVSACDDFSNLHTYYQKIISNPKELATLVSKCSNLKQLRQIFAQIIQIRFLELYPASFHYNNISRTYLRLQSPREALLVYIAMRCAGVSPDEFTLPIVLKAASRNLDVVLAGQVHGFSIKYGMKNDMYCVSGLISSYSKGGKFDMAQKVFCSSAVRKVGHWNAIIAGLSQGGRGREALNMFVEMMKSGICPDDMTMVCVTSACGSLGDLNLALQLHKFIFQVNRLEKQDVLTMNSVIDMYGKCGRMDLAYRVFCDMEEKNVSSWTSMIVGYAAHGHVDDALKCFSCMVEAGITPNHVTFVGVLTACVHGGMVQEGKYYFNMMKNGYGIEPMLPHYGCMVDLLGRAGMLDEAILMVEGMPLKPNAVIWGCLMGACENYGNVKLGEHVAKHLIELEPGNSGVYVVLSNIYANSGMWKELERVRKNLRERELAINPSYSVLK
ncbi:pentatricopeptide repeat-containing protein At1g77170, mitochondrial-like [Salvia hispanica]|uniref:pentatricopeptide repeat-containing protein At1g77170, mitochondrial-like n=1 Tax=Salvia hispanica TaxID=49212 RepID=UPI0020093587|nr:pentatricopeptide repeat-containing protein At1g77170, mitochondrial-like [Salvia hispanica]XP_047951354.1 pentatricopeptide repeat-containing protein At1g77170, mitochondrial-like [Salvia hispanica]XP_047951355.1 pentatricopeptide repeat-containing protein At1g77170, mitochondrial-like [Salvia hispanica]XP_047951356.1 pentatricopeptide repeat-containing protein At1g77170, mitochondrial-like [Salvia hispanica]XP_047951357.1 pentatricopeptide repeat-containing protein At1g77170, mitochondrial